MYVVTCPDYIVFMPMCTFTAIEHLALGSANVANIPTISAEEELSLLRYNHQRHFCFCLHGFRDIRTIWLFIWNAYWSVRWSLLSLIMLLHLRFKIASASTALPLPTSHFPENLSLNMLYIILGYYGFAYCAFNMYLHSISAMSYPFRDISTSSQTQIYV